MDTMLVTKSTMFLALLDAQFQELVYLYQQNEPLCWC